MMNDWQSFEVANPVGASRIRKIVTEARMRELGFRARQIPFLDCVPPTHEILSWGYSGKEMLAVALVREDGYVYRLLKSKDGWYCTKTYRITPGGVERINDDD